MSIEINGGGIKSILTQNKEIKDGYLGDKKILGQYKQFFPYDTEIQYGMYYSKGQILYKNDYIYIEGDTLRREFSDIAIVSKEKMNLNTINYINIDILNEQFGVGDRGIYIAISDLKGNWSKSSDWIYQKFDTSKKINVKYTFSVDLRSKTGLHYIIVGIGPGNGTNKNISYIYNVQII